MSARPLVAPLPVARLRFRLLLATWQAARCGQLSALVAEWERIAQDRDLPPALAEVYRADAAPGHGAALGGPVCVDEGHVPDAEGAITPPP